jgi:sulfur-oxidizing protein SoxZ
MSDVVRSLISISESPRAGQRVEVRCTIGHPMESGHRRGSDGQLMPRNIITSLECRFNGELMAAFKLHAAIASNPYVAFGFISQQSGTLQFDWRGDGGFSHTATREIALA